MPIAALPGTCCLNAPARQSPKFHFPSQAYLYAGRINSKTPSIIISSKQTSRPHLSFNNQPVFQPLDYLGTIVTAKSFSESPYSVRRAQTRAATVHPLHLPEDPRNWPYNTYPASQEIVGV